MAVDAFISYAHADARALERLRKHLSVLKREGTVRDWTDLEILPGDKLGATIDVSLSKSSIFVALLSPDYLASKFCYDTEFKQAQARAAKGEMRIIPVIVEPCDWQSSPFRDYLALPKDGKAVSEWANENIAFLDVVKGIRRVVEELNGGAAEYGLVQSSSGLDMAAEVSAPARRPRIQKDFDAIQKAEFADQVYEEIRAFFEASCAELTAAGDGVLKAKYAGMDANAFTCSVVNRAKARGGEAHITVRNVKGRGHFGDIDYVFEKYAAGNGSNGAVNVEADEYHLFLTMDRMFGGDREKLTAGQVAARLWDDFVKQAGVEYD